MHERASRTLTGIIGLVILFSAAKSPKAKRSKDTQFFVVSRSQLNSSDESMVASSCIPQLISSKIRTFLCDAAVSLAKFVLNANSPT